MKFSKEFCYSLCSSLNFNFWNVNFSSREKWIFTFLVFFKLIFRWYIFERFSIQKRLSFKIKCILHKTLWLAKWISPKQLERSKRKKVSKMNNKRFVVPFQLKNVEIQLEWLVLIVSAGCLQNQDRGEAKIWKSDCWVLENNFAFS